MDIIDNVNNQNSFNDIRLHDNKEKKIENELLKHIDEKLEQERQMSKKVNSEIINEVQKELDNFFNTKGDS